MESCMTTRDDLRIAKCINKDNQTLLDVSNTYTYLFYIDYFIIDFIFFLRSKKPIQMFQGAEK